MSFCPRCGAATSPGMSFCVACGEMLPTTPAAATTLDAGAAAVPRGPVGKRVHPLFAAAMALFLGGIYPLWFWWRTSREVDAYAGSKGHGPVRAGVGLLVLALALSIAVGASVSQKLDLVTLIETDGVQVATQRFAAEVAAHPWTTWQIFVSAAGSIVLLGGLWRVWTAMREEDQRRRRVAPWDPRIALTVLGGAALLPLLSFVVTEANVLALLDLLSLAFLVAGIIVVYQMQARLNETWASSSPLAPDGARW